MDTVTKYPTVEKSQAHARNMLAKIRKAHRRGRTRNADHFTRTYLNSFDARIVAGQDAADSLEKLKKPRPPMKVIREFADKMDPWKGTDEAVKLFMKRKNGDENDFRPIMSFGMENRMLQHLALVVLKERSELQLNQFVNNGGVTAAVMAVVSGLKAKYNFVAELDIEKCFTSFDGAKLPGLLPLPKGVTMRVIASAHLNLVPGNSLAELGPCDWSEPEELENNSFMKPGAAVWRGIPQGSSSSPFVTEMLLSPVLSQLPDKGIVVNYADNMLVMGRDVNDMEALLLVLRFALEHHPAGPLKPSWIKRYEPHETVEFLGYDIHRNEAEYRITPSRHNQLKFAGKFKKRRGRIFASEDSAKAKRDEILGLAKYVRTWIGSFSLWKEAQDSRQFYLKKVASIAKELEIVVDIKGI